MSTARRVRGVRVAAGGAGQPQAVNTYSYLTRRRGIKLKTKMGRRPITESVLIPPQFLVDVGDLWNR